MGFDFILNRFKFKHLEKYQLHVSKVREETFYPFRKEKKRREETQHFLKEILNWFL